MPNAAVRWLERRFDEYRIGVGQVRPIAEVLPNVTPGSFACWPEPDQRHDLDRVTT